MQVFYILIDFLFFLLLSVIERWLMKSLTVTVDVSISLCSSLGERDVEVGRLSTTPNRS